MHYLDPTNDLAFRKIFGDADHTESLISLINAVLGLEGPQEVVSVAISNPYQTPRIETLKETIVDVRAKDASGQEFVVEMQCKGGETWTKRAVYATCKAFVNQLGKGGDYSLLRPVYFIGVLRFRVQWDEIEKQGGRTVAVTPTRRDWLSKHVLMNQATLEQSSYDLSMHLIELPRFTQSLIECRTVVEKWAWFFKHAAELEAVPPELDEPGFRHAFDIAHQTSWSEAELDEYEKAQQVLSLGRMEMQASHAKGLQEGLERGKLEMAKNLASMGMSRAQIAEVAGVDAATLQEWLGD